MDHSSDSGFAPLAPIAASLPPLRVELGTREAHCPSHGGFASTGFRLTVGRGKEVWSPCAACERDRVNAEEQAQRDAARRARIERNVAMINIAEIPTRFVGKTFDNFIADTEEKRRALTAARDYAEQFGENKRRGKGLVFAGRPGTGKSHLAAAILQAQLTDYVRYMTCLDVIRVVRDTWRKDSERSETQVLNHLQSLDLLVIDEVGVQYGTEGEQTVLFDVLDRRYREMRPTILLTNQNLEGFKKFVGERTFDRIAETSRWISFEWESYRPTARREAA